MSQADTESNLDEDQEMDSAQNQKDSQSGSEPNKRFVEQFDTFCSFGKAAGFIEDWIRTKKHNATDFTDDYPAVL